MKIIIASDLHGSAKYCRMLVDAFKSEGADKLILLGDILYHGPRNPLPEDYNTQEVAKILGEIKDDIVCVRGNCDAEVDQMVLPFNVSSDYGVLCVDGLIFHPSHATYNAGGTSLFNGPYPRSLKRFGGRSVPLKPRFYLPS